MIAQYRPDLYAAREALAKAQDRFDLYEALDGLDSLLVGAWGAENVGRLGGGKLAIERAYAVLRRLAGNDGDEKRCPTCLVRAGRGRPDIQETDEGGTHYVPCPDSFHTPPADPQEPMFSDCPVCDANEYAGFRGCHEHPYGPTFDSVGTAPAPRRWVHECSECGHAIDCQHAAQIAELEERLRGAEDEDGEPTTYLDGLPVGRQTDE